MENQWENDVNDMVKQLFEQKNIPQDQFLLRVLEYVLIGSCEHENWGNPKKNIYIILLESGYH